jgi:hypothetical protein
MISSRSGVPIGHRRRRDDRVADPGRRRLVRVDLDRARRDERPEPEDPEPRERPVHVGDPDRAGPPGGGVGLRLGQLLLAFDVRLYPTYWFELDGTRLDAMATVRPIDESPGGIPTTATISLGIGY